MAIAKSLSTVYCSVCVACSCCSWYLADKTNVLPAQWARSPVAVVINRSLYTGRHRRHVVQSNMTRHCHWTILGLTNSVSPLCDAALITTDVRRTLLWEIRFCRMQFTGWHLHIFSVERFCNVWLFCGYSFWVTVDVSRRCAKNLRKDL